ncbi:excitatory amino acid transporter 1-like [Sebastes umbrosus]|uniref:excitatory amino acid transporter 1-like n=1 Tax=Sebastes umbrosus TaxID=72105 RepID=UPI00189D7CB2|nr:excitatory amino acid transporter 1-like [Sebastes umbrosus]XP_037642568.1 excitatory amino acid transporter 1-like [Sebastes umbrosus]XP_037642569.1 excitatory amino acid transporter 1-like [Sebastes umbrosus]
MLPSPNDLSELDSVEVTELQETQTYHKCNKPSGHVSTSQNGSKVMAFLKRNAFVVLTMASVALGIGLGFALRHINMTARDVKYLTFPGELLLRLLQMLVLPLIISSVIAGISSVDKKAYGKIGLRAFCYYMVTTIIAAFTGIALAVLIQPGKSSRTASVSSSGHPQAVQTVDSFLDLIRNMIPSNLVEACFRKYKSGYSGSVSTGKSLDVINMTETSENNDTVPVPGTVDGVNMLGLLGFSVAFGLILGSMGTEGKPLRDFFDCLNKAIMHLVNIFIWYTPVGMLFLLAGQILKMTDIGEIGREVTMYTLTVITGLLIHGLLTLPLIYFVVTRKNPFRFMLGLLQALNTAFGTSSSSATLPVTLYCMEENHNMDKQVTRIMLPIGATVNMDGAALYEAVAALFIAQVNDMEFNLGQIIVLSLIVTAASTGAAGIPQAGMVTMMIVLESAGLPTEDISLLFMMDWILDRLRTTINVLGDCIGVGVVQHLSRHELQRSSPAEQNLVEESTLI